MTQIDDETLRGLQAAITPGPWRTAQTVIHGQQYGGLWVECKDPDQSICITGGGGSRSYTGCIVDVQSHDDNDANASAIALVPDLLAEVLALRAKLAEERALTDSVSDALHHMVNASPETDQAADAALAAYDAARGKIGGAV